MLTLKTHDRRNMPLFPIRIVMQLTDLTARQIRYYEQHGLISPTRTEGNQRLFSFNDVDKLIEIKELIDQGINVYGIKQLILLKQVKKTEGIRNKVLSDRELRDHLKSDLVMARQHRRASLIQGQLSSFFIKLE